MGNPLNNVVNYIDYKKVLERGLSSNNLFVEKLMGKNKPIYCIFSTVNYYDYIFWKENPEGNITLFLEIDKKSQVFKYITGSITRIGKIMCDSTIKDTSLIDYLNTINI